MGDSLFSIDIVRDFMIDRGGKVRNHELVTHFKRFLNDPSCKASNREKFKDFVNTLASVKLDESGEKVLVLKKRYRDGAPITMTPSRGVDIQERGPRHELQRPKAKIRKQFDTTLDRSDSSPVPLVVRGMPAAGAVAPLPAPGMPAAGAVAPLPAPEELSHSYYDVSLPEESFEPAMPMEHRMDIERSPYVVEEPMHETQYDDYKENIPVRRESHSDDVFLGETPGESNTDVASTVTSVCLQGAVPGESYTDESAATGQPMRLGSPIGESTTDSPSHTEDTEDSSVSTPVSDQTLSLTGEEADGRTKPTTPLSVKDQARMLNKMTSEQDLQQIQQKKEPKSRHLISRDDDSNSVSSVGVAMDQGDREWMVTCASADYHPMHKLLQQNPQLAKKKDFITGFTALHWAAKHGKPDVVKLLMANQNNVEMPINAQSHGGYTPLHLASIHGHEEVIALLVHYGADASIRDFGGKKPKQYLRNAVSTSTHQMLQARRLGSTTQTNFRRQGSVSAKIQNSGFFGIRSNTTVRNSWQSDPASDRDRSSPSPSPSPRGSPGTGRKKSRDLRVPRSPRWLRRSSLQDDLMMMPPPKVAPNKRKKKKSVSDMTHASSESDVHMMRSGSTPDFKASKSQFI